MEGNHSIERIENVFLVIRVNHFISEQSVGKYQEDTCVRVFRRKHVFVIFCQ